MDGVTLLRRARSAGLRVVAEGDKLVVRGPRRAEPVALLLLAHKPAVSAALAGEWHARHREAAEYWSAFHSSAEAAALTWGEIQLRWHRIHGARSPAWQCAGCRSPIGGRAALAEAMVEGRVYVTRSRHGAPNELARQLVVAGIADRPMVIYCRGRAGTTTWRSFHAAAGWTYTEGDQPLRRVRYRKPPEGVFLVSGTGPKCVSSLAADHVDPPATDAHETRPPPTRFCEGCNGDFVPARAWSRFCSPACRLRAHRMLARDTRAQSFSSDLS